jgi:CspA family cold shock protein
MGQGVILVPFTLHRECGGPPLGGGREAKITHQKSERHMKGTIRTLRVDKGFGFIKSEAGQDYFFHQTAIYGEGIADLREGDGVEFEVSDSPKGPRAVDVKRTTT